MKRLDKKLTEARSKQIGGKLPRGSGNQWYAPGDVVDKHRFFLEHKYTHAESFRVSLELINKARKQAGALPWCIEVAFVEGEQVRDQISISESHFFDTQILQSYGCRKCNQSFGIRVESVPHYCPYCGGDTIGKLT